MRVGRGGRCLSSSWVRVVGVPLSWEGTFGVAVGGGALGCRGAGADGRCPPGKPTLYGSVTRRGLSSDGVPDIAASEGFVVGEVTKVPGLGGRGW